MDAPEDILLHHALDALVESGVEVIDVTGSSAWIEFKGRKFTISLEARE